MILQILPMQSSFHESVKQPFTLFLGTLQHRSKEMSQGHQAQRYANGVHQ